MQSGPQTGLKRQVWKGRQYPNVFQHFMFLGCLWVLMSGLKVLAGPAIFWCLGAMLHTSKITSRSLASSGNSNSILVYNKSGPKQTLPGSNCPFWLKPLSFKGIFVAAKGLWECHNLRGAIPRHWFRRPSEVDHDRLLLWSCRCPGWVSATGDLSKREATEGKWRAKYCSMFWI